MESDVIAALSGKEHSMRPVPEFRNFIGGEWVCSSSGNTFENRNPANRQEILGIFQKSNANDVEAAIGAARDAYKKWRLMPAPRRAEILFRVGEILLPKKERKRRQMPW